MAFLFDLSWVCLCGVFKVVGLIFGATTGRLNLLPVVGIHTIKVNWLRFLEEITGFQGNNPYFYPPWYAVLFIPLTFVPFQTARLIWLGLNVVMFYWGLENTYFALLGNERSWKTWGIYFLATMMFAVICMVSEQAGIFLFLGLSFVLRYLKSDQPVGVWLGFGHAGHKAASHLFCLFVSARLALFKSTTVVLLDHWLGLGVACFFLTYHTGMVAN